MTSKRKVKTKDKEVGIGGLKVKHHVSISLRLILEMSIQNILPTCEQKESEREDEITLSREFCEMAGVSEKREERR